MKFFVQALKSMSDPVVARHTSKVVKKMLTDKSTRKIVKTIGKEITKAKLWR